MWNNKDGEELYIVGTQEKVKHLLQIWLCWWYTLKKDIRSLLIAWHVKVSALGMIVIWKYVFQNKSAINIKKEGGVCPSQLLQKAFTTAAIDNLEHNFTTAIATLSYHGTTISIFPYADAPLQSLSLRIDDAIIERKIGVTKLIHRNLTNATL